MAFLHCDSCGWQQDDFWNLRLGFRWKSYKKSWRKLGFSIGYNPISRMLGDVRWLWVPRWKVIDDWIINDITEHTVKVKVRKRKKVVDQTNFKVKIGNRPDIYTVTENQVFSWEWLGVEFIKNWKSFRNMKWWTYKSWEKVRAEAVCPKCGDRNFDID